MLSNLCYLDTMTAIGAWAFVEAESKELGPGLHSRAASAKILVGFD